LDSGFKEIILGAFWSVCPRKEASMDKPIFHSVNSINFVVRKTNLPFDIVERLSDVEVPGHWDEAVRTILENYNKPGTLALHGKMIREREEFVKNLPREEVANLQEFEAEGDYVERLMYEGGVEKETAEIFAMAVIDWYKRLEENIISALIETRKS
jgi:hypothetical protein